MNALTHDDRSCCSPERTVDLGPWRQRYERLLHVLEESENLPFEKNRYEYWAEQLLELLQCDVAGIRLLTVTGCSFVRCALSTQPSSPPQELFTDTLSATTGRIPFLMEEQKPILMDFLNPHDDDLKAEALTLNGCLSGVTIPIVHNAEMLGIFTASYKCPPWWDDDDIEFLAEVGRLLGAVVKRENAKAKEVEIKVLEEGRKLCSEIHDNLAQAITIAKLEAEKAAMSLEDGDMRALAADLKRVESACENASDLVRNELLALRAAFSSSEGLVQEARTILKNFEAMWGIDAELKLGDIPEDLTISKQTKVQLLRILSEALSNVYRHAGASAVSVSIDGDESFLHMTVTDNGRGFCPAGVGSDRLGIKIMRERVEAMGGKLVVHSVEGEGTTVCTVAPRLA